MGIILKSKFSASFHLDQPQILQDIDILVENGTIKKIGKNLHLKNLDHEVVELPHHIMLPGLVNTHNHTAMTLFRGYADDYPLREWLEKYIWPKEANLDETSVHTGAKFAAVEAILSGTTTVNSMYWYPESEAKAFGEVGVKLMIGPPVISGVSSLHDSQKLVEKFHGMADDKIRIALNPHAPYTVTREDYVNIKQYKDEYNKSNPEMPALKIHTHLAEGSDELDNIQKFASDKGFDLPAFNSPVEYLDKINLLDQDLIAAHVVECSPQDIDVLKKRKVGLATNVSSNMKLGHNIPRIEEMVQKYHKVGLGTDGPSSNNNLDMFEAMKLSALAVKSKKNNPTLLPATKMLQLATIGGGKALGWENIGAIQEGYRADLIAVDLMKPHLRPITSLQSILSHLVYSANGSDVSHVMIDGKWVMKEREVLGINLRKLIEEFDSVANKFLDTDFSD